MNKLICGVLLAVMTGFTGVVIAAYGEKDYYLDKKAWRQALAGGWTYKNQVFIGKDGTPVNTPDAKLLERGIKNNQYTFDRRVLYVDGAPMFRFGVNHPKSWSKFMTKGGQFEFPRGNPEPVRLTRDDVDFAKSVVGSKTVINSARPTYTLYRFQRFMNNTHMDSKGNIRSLGGKLLISRNDPTIANFRVASICRNSLQSQ